MYRRGLVLSAALGLYALLSGCARERPVHGTTQSQARADLRRIERALADYRDATGTWPDNGDGLRALVNRPSSAPAGWRQSFKAIPTDPWGRQYHYRFSPALDRVSIWSFGEDPVNGADDVRIDRLAGLSR